MRHIMYDWAMSGVDTSGSLWELLQGRLGIVEDAINPVRADTDLPYHE